MGLRQMLPVQTKRTLFTMNAAAMAPLFKLESEQGKSTGPAICETDSPLRCHPERSAAKSRDPVAIPVGNFTGSLDFARDDNVKRLLGISPFLVTPGVA